MQWQWALESELLLAVGDIIKQSDVRKGGLYPSKFLSSIRRNKELPRL